MFNEKILEVIAKTPGCREAAIYDAVSVDADETRAAISVLETAGAIVAIESEGVTEYGRVFEFTEEFKESDLCKRITLKATAAKLPGANRIERAIAFVKERGTATSSELHALMGLSPDEYASNALACAVRTKRLVKDGKNWTLGPGPGGPAVPVTPTEDHETSRVTPGSRAAPFPVPTFLHKEAEAAQANDAAVFRGEDEQKPAQVAAAVAPVEVPRRAKVIESEPKAAATPAPAKSKTAIEPALRCGLWSDGTVELRRDDQTVVILSAQEATYLAEFWTRVSIIAKEAA